MTDDSMLEKSVVPAQLTHVFISYSRHDSDRVKMIEEALSRMPSLEVVIDYEDILPAEEWKKRLKQMIVRADTVVFCLSTSSARSDVCAWEVATAESLSKRIVPVVLEEVGENVPGGLAKLNYVFFTSKNQFVEALPLLTNAIMTDIEWLRSHTRYTEIASLWKVEASEDQLLRGQELNAAESWLAKRPVSAPLPADMAVKFIRESRNVENEILKRASFRSQAISLSSIIALILITTLSVFLYSAWQNALKNQSRILAREATQIAHTGDIRKARLIALEVLPDKRASLFSRAYWRPSGEPEWDEIAKGWISTVSMLGHTDSIRSIAISPGFDFILTTSFDNSGILWSVDGTKLQTLLGHEDSLWHGEFSPSDELIVTASSDGTARIWNYSGDIQAVLRPPGPKNLIYTASFSRDGQLIVTAGNSNHAHLWSSDGLFVGTLTGHNENIRHVEFSPDGKFIVTASDDGSARVYDRSGEYKFSIDHHDDSVLSARFHPDSKLIVTASADNTARVFDLTGHQIALLDRHSDVVWTAIFTPDGSRILTTSRDSTGHLWTSSGNHIKRLSDYSSDAPTQVSFNRDGIRMLITESYGASVYDMDGNLLQSSVGFPGPRANLGSFFVRVGESDWIYGQSGNDAHIFRYMPDHQAFIEFTKNTIDICLTESEHQSFGFSTVSSWNCGN